MEDHKNARFFEADFGSARFHGVNFSNVKVSDAWLFNVDISGLVANLTVNGVDVSAYVEQTLRHLVFATDRWITGPVLEEAEPFHPLGQPNPPLDQVPAGMFDLDARPPLDDVLSVRRGRMQRVGDLVQDISGNELDRQVPSPNGGMTGVLDCVRIVFREEWCHDQYARRDLAILEARS